MVAMADIDELLGVLAHRAVPPALGSLEGSVLAGLAERRERANARRAMAAALLVAAFVGAFGSVVPSAPAQAEPLFGIPAGAPSHLLAD